MRFQLSLSYVRGKRKKNDIKNKTSECKIFIDFIIFNFLHDLCKGNSVGM